MKSPLIGIFFFFNISLYLLSNNEYIFNDFIIECYAVRFARSAEDLIFRSKWTIFSAMLVGIIYTNIFICLRLCCRDKESCSISRFPPNAAEREHFFFFFELYNILITYGSFIFAKIRSDAFLLPRVIRVYIFRAHFCVSHSRKALSHRHYKR